MNREILIDAIIGRGFGSRMQFAIDMQGIGAAMYTGNQHNESWAWNRPWLERNSDEELRKIYELAGL